MNFQLKNGLVVDFIARYYDEPMQETALTS